MLRAQAAVKRASLAAAFAAGIAVSAFTFAQTTGLLEGTVRDQNGTSLPGVKVTVGSARLQGSRTIATGPNGVYRFPAVPPGEYLVHAELPGFRTQEKAAIVSLDATATADFALEPEVREAVVVTGEAPIVDTTSTTTGTNYTDKVIQRLPVSRNYADIVLSNPGVDQDRGITQGRSLALTIYGATSAENQWIIDGVNTTNVLSGTQGKAINNEFVQEVEIKTGSYQAEYGHALGGVVNVITKSGGNEYHGGAFVYYDSQTLTADQVFTDEDTSLFGMRVADYHRTDFGADLGGFIVRDQLWFFGAYNRVDAPAEVSPYQDNGHVTTSDRFPVDGADNLYSGKITWNIASATTLVGTIFADPTTIKGAAGADPRQGVGSINAAPITNPDPSTWYSERHIGSTDYGLRANQIFSSSALLQLQWSRHQDKYALAAPDGVRTEDFTCQGGNPASPCSVPGAPNFVTGGYGFIFGAGNNSASHRDQVRGDLNLYLGNHELKAGGDYQDAQTDGTSYFSGGQRVRIRNENGVTYYVHQFFSSSSEQPVVAPEDTVHARTKDFGAYVQDSWRPTPGLTVNVGFRWDQENVYGYHGTTAFQLKSEWQPRIGVVWDPTNDGRTKVYAFGGRFYYSLPTDLAARVYDVFPFSTTYNFDPVSVTPDPNAHDPDAFLPGPPVPERLDSGLKGVHQDEYTIGIERLLDPTFTVGLKGTYRRLSSAIEDRCDLDYNAPENQGSQCALVNPGSNEPIARGDVPGCFDVYNGYECGPTIAAQVPVRRLYRGIEVMARKTVGDRLWLQASYVYSSLRGNYDGEVSEGYYGQTDPGINADFDYAIFNHNGYGKLFLDRPHRLRLDGFDTLPFGLGVGLQFWVTSGAPLNKIGYFNDSYGSYIQLVTKGYAGRMPTQWDSNLTLSYPLHVGPATVTLQGYLFNLFNRQTPTYEDTVYSTVPPPGYDDNERTAILNPNQPQSNDTYGKVTERTAPRYFRAAVKISF